MYFIVITKACRTKLNFVAGDFFATQQRRISGPNASLPMGVRPSRGRLMAAFAASAAAPPNGCKNARR
jgi:hypothetical protein